MAFALGLDNKVIVPWYSKLEWNEVYQQVYSNDSDLQRNGYERMLQWKARNSSLPAGIECTLGLVHANLQYQDVWPQIENGLLPPYKENDLRLVISTAIMRFLNLISIVAHDGSETMYTMATKLNIPDWVVNIRHDVAHGLNLPPLSVLREAMHFALDWIHENYWKGEALVVSDHIGSEDSGKNIHLIKQLQEYIELWQSLKIYQMNGCINIKNVSDQQLNIKLKIIIENIHEGKKKTGSTNGSVDGRSPAKDKYINMKSADVLEDLIQYIKGIIQKNKTIFDANELLVITLLKGETFLLAEKLLSILSIGDEDKTESLPVQLCQLWKDMLSTLEVINILPILIVQLIKLSGNPEEIVYRRKMAAVWVKELCKGYLKGEKMRMFIKQQISIANEKQTEKKVKQFKKNVSDSFEKAHPEFRNGFTFRVVQLPFLNIDLIKQVMLAPNIWSNIFLPNLLDLVKPCISSSSRDYLIDILSIYTSKVVGKNAYGESNIYTVQMIINEANSNDAKDEEPTPMNIDDRIDDSCDAADGWVLSEENLEWVNCPLGVLPWQRNLLAIDYSLPRDVQWKSSLPLFYAASVKSTGILQKEVKWNELNLKKRTKKKSKRNRFGELKNN